MIAKGALLAGILDVLENIGMLVSLSGYTSNAVAVITTFCVSLKWLLALAALLYLLIALLQFAFIRKLISAFV